MNRSIKKIEIKNFQSHQHTIINLHEGINIITGTSNAGKTAINRAILWALTNKPRGDDFISSWSDYASVKITFYDGDRLWRFRGKDDNFLTIYPSGQKSQKYEKFGAEYPEEVRKFLSMPKSNSILSNVFYADQLNPLFLINLSSADLPRAIGYLAGSDIMESAVGMMQSDLKTLKKDLEKLLTKKSQVEKDQLQYSDLDDQLIKFNQLKNKNNDLQDCSNILIGMNSLIDVYKNTKLLIDDGKNKLDAIDGILKNKHKIQELREWYDKLTSANDFYNNYYSTLSNYECAKKQIDVINKNNSKISLSEIQKIKHHIESLQKIEDYILRYDSSVGAISEIKEQIILIDEFVKNKSERVKQIRQKLTDNNYICSKCGQVVN